MLHFPDHCVGLFCRFKPQWLSTTWKFITLTDQTNHIVGHNAIVRHTLTGETERDGKTAPVKIGAHTSRVSAYCAIVLHCGRGAPDERSRQY